jgi:hypothetical protein
MTYPEGRTPDAIEPAQEKRRQPAFWVVIGVCATIVTAAIIASMLTFAHKGSDRDAYAKVACAELERSQHEGMLDGAISEIKAIGDARKSSNADLRAAANKTSIASTLPLDSPLYQNPGDVQASAVATWCNKHR